MSGIVFSIYSSQRIKLKRICGLYLSALLSVLGMLDHSVKAYGMVSTAFSHTTDTSNLGLLHYKDPSVMSELIRKDGFGD